MEYLLLGSIAVAHGDDFLALGGLRQRTVLAALLLSADLTVDIDTLTDQVWDGSPPPKPITSLRAYVANLRRTLADDHRTDRLVTDGRGYRLQLGQDRLDTRMFETQVGRGKRLLEARDPSGAAQALADALRLWRGNPLADFRDLSFAHHEIHRMEALRSDAVEAHYEAELLQGRDVELIAGLEKEIAANPLREQLWGHLMLAMYRAGRRADALTAFRRLHSVLDDELGVRPGASLDRLATKIRHESPDLEWRPPVTQLAIPTPSRAGPLFGRIPELTLLHDAMIATAEGRGAIAVLTGDGGLGKTALANEVTRWAQALGMASCWVGHGDGIRIPPLWTWTRVLRGLTNHDAPAPADSTAADRRSRAYFTEIEAMATALVEAVGRRPTVIVIDDLHRADRATHDVLGLLTSFVPRMPLLILATWQDSVMTRVRSERECTRLLNRSDIMAIRLRGIDQEATAKLVESVAGVSPTPALVQSIEVRTGGNPFYIKELSRLLTESGRLNAETREISGQDVPDVVSTVIRSRMARLPRGTKAAVDVAALLGSDFEVTDVADVLGLPISGVAHELEPAIRMGVISIGGPNRFRFSPALFRDAVAARITGVRRSVLHARIARMFADRGTLTPQDSFTAANHAWWAGSELAADTALSLLDRALAVAWERSAYLEVAAFSAHGLDVCARLDPGRLRCEREAALWLQLVSVRAVTTGQNSNAVREALSRLAEIDTGSGQFTLEAAFRCLEAAGSGRYREAAILADGLIAMYQDGADAVAGSAGYYLRGLVEFFRGDLELSTSAIDTLMYRLPTVDWERQGHLAAFDVRGYGVAVWTAAVRGQRTAVEAWTISGLALARSRNDEFGRVIVRISALQARAIIGITPGTVEMAREVYAELTGLGVNQLASSAQIIEGWAAALGPDKLDTSDAVREAIEAHSRDGGRIFLPMYYLLLSDIEAAHGRTDAARIAVDTAEKITASTGERVWGGQLAARTRSLRAARSRPDLIRT